MRSYMHIMAQDTYPSSLASANLVGEAGNEARVAHEDSCLDLRDSSRRQGNGGASNTLSGISTSVAAGVSY